MSRRVGGRKGRRRGGWKEGWGKGRRRAGGQRLNNGSSSLIRWRSISSVKRGKSFGVRRGFERGFGWS
jgi:hypothetical protein